MLERLAQLRQHGLGASKSGLLLEGFSEAAARSVEDCRSKADPAQIEQAVTLLAVLAMLLMAVAVIAGLSAGIGSPMRPGP